MSLELKTPVLKLKHMSNKLFSLVTPVPTMKLMGTLQVSEYVCLISKPLKERGAYHGTVHRGTSGSTCSPYCGPVGDQNLWPEASQAGM